MKMVPSKARMKDDQVYLIIQLVSGTCKPVLLKVIRPIIYVVTIGPPHV